MHPSYRAAPCKVVGIHGSKSGFSSIITFQRHMQFIRSRSSNGLSCQWLHRDSQTLGMRLLTAAPSTIDGTHHFVIVLRISSRSVGGVCGAAISKPVCSSHGVAVQIRLNHRHVSARHVGMHVDINMLRIRTTSEHVRRVPKRLSRVSSRCNWPPARIDPRPTELNY